MATFQPPILTLTGEIDAHAVRGLSESFNSLIGSRSSAVVVDVSAVDFMDSTGLGALVRLHQRLRRQDRRLVLICPPGPVYRLLEVTNLLSTFAPVPDDDAAQQAARAFGGEKESEPAA